MLTDKVLSSGLIFNSLIMKIHINHLGALPQLSYAFKHLLNLMDKTFVNFKDVYGENRAIKTLQGLHKRGRHVVAMRNPHKIFSDRLRIKNNTFVQE